MTKFKAKRVKAKSNYLRMILYKIYHLLYFNFLLLISQISNSSVTASLHFETNPFNFSRLIPNVERGADPPHPSTLEKSFPVPNGTIPMGHDVTSM